MFFRIGCLLSAACCELRCKVGGMPAADLKAIAEFSTCLVACFMCAVLAFADAPSFLTLFSALSPATVKFFSSASPFA